LGGVVFLLAVLFLLMVLPGGQHPGSILLRSGA
jgi:hypothetical protein